MFNRGYMEQILPREIRRVDRLGGDFALLMLDVNDFKAVNGWLGHLEGDYCLQQVAQMLKSTFRASAVDG